MTRYIPPAELTIIQKRGALRSVPMVWVAARDRDTNNPLGVGFWMGADTEDIHVRDILTGVVTKRTFYSQTLLGISSLRYEAGLNIHPVTITLSSIHPACQLAFREYEPRGANVQIYRRTYDPDKRSALATRPKWCGHVDHIEITRPAPNGEATIVVECVPMTRELTISSSLKKSDTVQRRRKKGAVEDRIRRYKDAAAQWDIPWGSEDRG